MERAAWELQGLTFPWRHQRRQVNKFDERNPSRLLQTCKKVDCWEGKHTEFIKAWAMLQESSYVKRLFVEQECVVQCSKYVYFHL